MSHGNAAPIPGTGGPDVRTGSAAAFLEEAYNAFKDGRFSHAESILRQIVEQRPDDAGAWHIRGLNAAAAGNEGLATQSFIRSVQLDTGAAPYCAALADHLCRLALDHAAVEPWQRAVDLSPDNYQYRAGLARCLARLGRHADALPQGDYTIRLVLVGRDGNFFGRPHQVPITIGR